MLTVSQLKKLSASQQSRVNGAKSKGPKTTAGKARSSRNNLQHGACAVINIALQIEDVPAFELHRDRLRTSFNPRDYAEECYVDQLVGITWRQNRLVALETALLDAQLALQHDNVCKLHPQSADDPYFHLAQAWQALARQPKPPAPTQSEDPSLPPTGYDISSLDLLCRYQRSLDRQHRNTLLNLDKYRQNFPPNQTERDEPEPPQPTEIKKLILISERRETTPHPSVQPPRETGPSQPDPLAKLKSPFTPPLC